MCWIGVNKDILPEFHWLLKLQSRSGHKYGNVGCESLQEGKWIERKMGENLLVGGGLVQVVLVQHLMFLPSEESPDGQIFKV